MKNTLPIFLFILLVISCSEKESVNHNNSNSIDPSNFGTVTSMPNVFFDKVNSFVGIWNPQSNVTSNNLSGKKHPGNSTQSSLTNKPISIRSSNEDNYEYIENKMKPVLIDINNLIDQELNILGDINRILDDYYEEFQTDSFNYDKTAYNLIKDSLFVRAEDFHKEAISKRHNAIQISSEAVGINAYNVANYYITEISKKINNAVPVSVESLGGFYSLTTTLKEAYGITFTEEVLLKIDEFNSVPFKLESIINSYNGIMENVSINLYGSDWFGQFHDITYPTFDEETYNVMMNEFQNYVDDINTKLELFKNYYNQSKTLEIEFEDVISELTYVNSKNFAKMIFDHYAFEISHNYSKMNALKLQLLTEYLRNRAIYLVNIGPLWQERIDIYDSGTGYERIPCNSYERLIGLDQIEADANLIYPDFEYLGVSFEDWPAYDEQFSIGYTFSGERGYLRDDIEIRIGEFGCSCFMELGFISCDEVIIHINSDPPYN